MPSAPYNAGPELQLTPSDSAQWVRRTFSPCGRLREQIQATLSKGAGPVGSMAGRRHQDQRTGVHGGDLWMYRDRGVDQRSKFSYNMGLEGE
jgi:hypothetical protein